MTAASGHGGSVVDLFAGCGGASLGLRRAGWSHLACVESDPSAAATLEAAGFPTIQKDIRNVEWSTLCEFRKL